MVVAAKIAFSQSSITQEISNHLTSEMCQDILERERHFFLSSKGEILKSRGAT